MTQEEKNRALDIIKKYETISRELDRIISSLNRLEKKKSEALFDLDSTKREESIFMSDYKKKYGNDIDLFSLMNSLSK